MDLECIGMRIREKRIEKKWSQEVLAYETDLSTIYIGMIERGEKLPKLATFLKIIDCLDATPNEILVDLFSDHHGKKMYQYKHKIQKLSDKEQKNIYKILDTLLEEK